MMTLPDWMKRWVKRLLGPLKETANLVSLTILVVASWLTDDSGLLVIGMVVEVAYLGLALLLTCRWLTSGQFMSAKVPRLALLLTNYRKHLGRRRVRPDQSVEDFILDQVLLLVTVAGFVVIIFFGFGKHLLSHRWFNLTHAQGWEAGAIGWTILFLIYYLIKFKATGNDVLDKSIIIILVAANIGLIWQAVESMGQPFTHVRWVLGIAACFLFIDLLSALRPSQSPQQKIEKMRSRASLVWADIPMVVTLGVLLIYLYWHRDTEAPDVFVSGVVACQLLISNAVFIVMEFGLLHSSMPSGAAE